MFQTKVVEKIKMHFILNNSPLQKKNHALFETIWKNTVELGKPQMTVWHMCIACWITKVTHSQNM